MGDIRPGRWKDPTHFPTGIFPGSNLAGPARRVARRRFTYVPLRSGMASAPQLHQAFATGRLRGDQGTSLELLDDRVQFMDQIHESFAPFAGQWTFPAGGVALERGLGLERPRPALFDGLAYLGDD